MTHAYDWIQGPRSRSRIREIFNLWMRTFGRVTVLLSLLVAATCHGPPPPPPIASPDDPLDPSLVASSEVASVVFPTTAITVTQIAGAEVNFTIEAWLFTNTGRRITNPALYSPGDDIDDELQYEFDWKDSPGLVVTKHEGLFTAEVSIPATANLMESSTAEVTVSVNGVDAEAPLVVTIFPDIDQPSPIIIQAPHSDGKRPTVVVVDQLQSHDDGLICVADRVLVFVQAGSLGQTCGDGEVTVLADGQGMWLGQIPMGDAPLVVPVVTKRPVALAMTLTVTDDELDEDEDTDISDVEQGMWTDFDTATLFMNMARVGIELTVLDGAIGDARYEHDTIGVSCSTTDSYSTLDGRPTSLETGMLNVYYVWTGPYNGEACWPLEGRAEMLVFLPYLGRRTSTLAHELGHAFGLWLPNGGHPRELLDPVYLPEFRSTNIMAYANPYRPEPRSHLTPGQAFRMNADTLSWVKPQGLPLPQRFCQCDPYASGPCVPLASDQDNESPWTHVIEPGLCGDRIQVQGEADDLNSIVLVHAPIVQPDDHPCTWTIGTRHEDPVYDWIYVFPNLHTMTNECRTATIFYEDRLPLTVNLPTAWKNFNRKNNFHPIGGTPGTYAIDLALHYEAGVSSGLSDGMKRTTKLFGGVYNGIRNRVGVTVVWTESTAALPTPTIGSLESWLHLNDNMVDCPVLPPPPTDDPAIVAAIQPAAVNIYVVLDEAARTYLGTDGYSCMGGDEAYILLTPSGWSNGSLEHHLGHLFGLDEVQTGNLPQMGLDNLMAPPGNGDRTTLTLGQVYRIHFGQDSWLANKRGIGDSKNCDMVSCPSLDMNGPPE